MYHNREYYIIPAREFFKQGNTRVVMGLLRVRGHSILPNSESLKNLKPKPLKPKT